MSVSPSPKQFSYGAKWGIIAATILVVVGYFGFQAFGETILGVALTSNPALENGLVLHWTFDSSDVDPSTITAEIRDTSSGGNHGNSVFPPNHASSSTSTASTVIFLTGTGTSTWTVPADWTDSATIEVIGGGGAGRTGTTAGSGGGAGGGYSKLVGVTGLSPGGSVQYVVGAGGTATGDTGDNTHFCNSTSNCAGITGTAVIAGARGGPGATSAAGATSAGTTNAVGTIKYSGGNGAAGSGNSDSGGGGGGAGGPFGNGAAGGIGDTEIDLTDSTLR